MNNERRIHKMTKWICTNNPAHIFDKCTIDGICPTCSYGDGILIQKEKTPDKKGEPANEARQIGLGILVMDASGSMRSAAFPNSPAKKRQLIAASAARGILELETTMNISDAYISIVMFDTKTLHVLIDTAENLINKYSDPMQFITFFKENLEKFGGGTDINSALEFAKEIRDDLIIRGDLSKWGGPNNIEPIEHVLFDKNNNSITVPNIRILIYTDGEDTENGGRITNPFANEPVDILMGAYFGQGEENGCTKLMNALSECPTHGVKQFFLINDPNRIQTLKNLFRMASGTSGFCPVCLAQANKGYQEKTEFITENNLIDE
jgi:von Willebrand factor type A domain